MTPTEIISTSVAAASLLFAWLSRQDSRRSAQEARRANDLLELQLALASNEQKRRLQNELAESQPLISWRGAGGLDEGQYFDFTNMGSVISQPKVIVDHGLEGWIEPKDVIASGQKARLKFNLAKIQKLPSVVKLSIEFTDKRNQRGKIDFNLLSHTVGKYFNFPPQLA